MNRLLTQTWKPHGFPSRNPIGYGEVKTLNSRRVRASPSRPLAFAEDRRAGALRVEAVDVDLVRADHPIDMDHALVAALLGDLLGAELRAVDEAFRVALPKRDVACGVLVE